MAKLTRAQIESQLSGSTELPAGDVRRLLTALATLAYENASDGFLLPGFGEFTVAPDEKHYRQPGTGEMVPGPLRLEFRVDSTALESFTRKTISPVADSEPLPAKTYPEIRFTPSPNDVEAANLGKESVAKSKNKIGGTADWIQPPSSPTCCATRMSFFGQLDSSIDDTFNIVDRGMIYVFLCEHCANTKSVLQCG